MSGAANSSHCARPFRGAGCVGGGGGYLCTHMEDPCTKRGSVQSFPILALVSSSLLVLAGSTQASSSPPAAPKAAAAAADGTPLGADAVAIARKHVAKHAARVRPQR